MAYAFVQQLENSDGVGTPRSTFSLGAFGSNPTAANLFWYVVFYNNGTEQTCALSDTRTNTFTEIGHFFDATDGLGFRWGYAKNLIGSGTDTVLLTFGGNITFPAGYVAEYSGLDTTAPFTSGESAVQFQASPGTGTNALSSGNTPTLAAQPAVLVGFGYDDAGPNFVTAGTAFTARAGVFTFGGTFGADQGIPEDRRLTATTAVAANFTASAGTGFYFTIAAVFKELGAGGGATFPPVPTIGLIDQRNNPVFRM